MAFFGWFVHYLLIFVVLAGVGGVGFLVGKKMADKKALQTAGASDAKDAK